MGQQLYVGAEVHGVDPPAFLQQLFAADFGKGSNNGNYRRLGASLADTIVQGGYPAALARPTEKRRANWYRDYITTIVQRDVQDLTRIQKLEMLPRLLSMAAGLGSPFAWRWILLLSRG